MYHVIRPEGAAHLNRPHVIVHRMKLYDDEITLLDGIPITTPERTWLDLAEMLTVDQLVVAGDSCVRMPRPELEGREAPLCSLQDLQRMIDRHKGKRGIRKAKEAIALIRVGSDSPQEFLVSGFSLHEELEALSLAGLTHMRCSRRPRAIRRSSWAPSPKLAQSPPASAPTCSCSMRTLCETSETRGESPGS